MSFGQPDPPSPSAAVGTATQAAAAQVPYSQQAQQQSQYNQNSAYGNLSYTPQVVGTGPNGTPIYSYTANTNFSPTQQGLYDALTATQKKAGDQAGKALGFGRYDKVSPTKAIGDISTGLTGQGMTQGLAFLQPFFKTQTDQADTTLRNQGLTPGNPAYDVAMRQIQTNQGLQVNNMMESLFPTEQDFAMKEYGLPLSVGTSLAKFGSPATPDTGFTSALPGFTAPNTAADYATATQAQQNQYQAQQAQYNAMISAIGGVAGTVGGAMLGGPVGASLGGSLGKSLGGTSSTPGYNPSQFTQSGLFLG